ncbi:hypothetical protein EPUL_001427 [Erysiphe pulchra]|uniref:SWR1-complex protein 4 n=1 Tax=Erysiphe pulchra TaxID=225359 RepID=A0A2S4PTW0_9PEZI|nr:hypothetical protein EPUL_001427 [Erysiphe pulchra]
MSSHDFRDMLNLPGEARRSGKKQKASGTKAVLKGLAREVQNLSGDNPIAIVPKTSIFKKRRIGSRKPAAKWQLKPFKNTARNDQTLILKHWRRKVEDSVLPGDEKLNKATRSDIEDSIFAKFNVRVKVVNYNENQYNNHLQSPDWTKDETDYLMKLVEEYDLRWPVIWDRYNYLPPSSVTSLGNNEKAILTITNIRSMEDIKERFYKVSAKIMQLSSDKNCLSSYESNQLEAMLKFNKQQEIARKGFAEATFHRTIEEAKEEENLLLELKRILARSEKLGHERQELYTLLDAPPSTNTIGAYTSSQGLQQLLASLVQADKAKRNKSLSKSLVSPAGPNQNNQSNIYVDSRRDSSVREPVSATINNKKVTSGSSDRRQLTPEEETLYGVRYFDRITTTGPAFRHDKIMKLMISKSSIQQAKIRNILSELRIPPRLLMPTYRVGELFECLQQDISALLELRKVADKLQGEINVLKALKEERGKLGQLLESNAENQKERDEENEDDNLATKEIAPKEDTVPKIESLIDEKKEIGTTLVAHKRSTSVVSNQSLKRRKK